MARANVGAITAIPFPAELPALSDHAISDTRPAGGPSTISGEQEGLPAPQRTLAILTVLMTLVLVVLDGAIANIALPSIERALNSTSADTVWVVSSYQLAVIVALLPCGALGEALGARRVFLAGVALFTAASLLCAMATNLPLLITARFLQGLGGGAIMALSSMMMRFICPPGMFGTIIGINAMTVAISSAAGPAIGGAILALADWRWLFAVNLPVGALVLILSRVLPRPARHPRQLALSIMIMNGAMFVLFFAGADLLVRQPFLGVPMLAASALLLAIVIRRERVREAPLVPIDLFRDPAFRVATIASVVCFAAQMMSYVSLPFLLQHDLGQSETASGLSMIPWPASVAVVAPLAGRLANRVPTGLLCLIDGLAFAAGMVVIALFSRVDDLTGFYIGSVIAGAGFGFFQTPNNRILLLTAPKSRSGAAGATQGTARLVGQTMGAIGMSLIFVFADGGVAPRIGLGVAACFAVAASIVSGLRIRYERAAS